MLQVKKVRVGIVVCMLLIMMLFMKTMTINLGQPFFHSITVTRFTEGLDAPARVSDDFELEGGVFGSDGLLKELSTMIHVSLIHSFSPDTEKHFREMMVDPVRNEHRIYANSPAILQLKSGEVITVMRVWLEKEIWDLTKQSPHNTFSDNYFYIQRFDRQMKPITTGRILGIATPIQWSIGDGPIEPRIFTVNDTIYLTFNTGIFTETRKTIDSTFVWDLTSNKAIMPKIYGGQPMVDNKQDGSMPRDKHWAALVKGPKLFFTYNLDPLRVIDCGIHNSSMDCTFVHKEGAESYTFKDQRDGLRGGTPFVLYKYPYYISVAHGTYFRDCRDADSRCNGRRYYTTHIILMTIEPDFKIVYVSGNIAFPEESFQIPLVRYRFIESSFFFPVGLILENADSLVLGGHINDHSSVLYRISNISSVMKQVIELDQLASDNQGPALGVFQDYTRLMAEKFSGMKFQSGQ
ncbi:uncharacterized protein [Watersipora subatra]|uniref:uncharacterized protein n=1 Tax=Watersipora subatra TaxID=2589382 RepID=UPI00355C27F5